LSGNDRLFYIRRSCGHGRRVGGLPFFRSPHCVIARLLTSFQDLFGCQPVQRRRLDTQHREV
jgi:hypothetical protein